MLERLVRGFIKGLGCALALTTTANAQVTQLDGTPLPQPVGMAEWNLVTMSWAYNRATLVNTDANGMEISNLQMTFGDFYPTFEDGDAITLEGLFKWRGEQIDAVADARTAPGHFSPTCGFSGELVMMGGNCEVAFGWYNVDDPTSTTPPPPEEIFELIPSNTQEYLNCLDQNGNPKTDGFCPLGWDNVSPRHLDIEVWQPQAFDSGMIKDDPNYRGGAVGFAVIGSPTKSCSENKHSLREHNQRNTAGEPWVTTLVYQSTVDPEGFYLAFEDLPMSPEDWRKVGIPGQIGENDGDFNDYVFFISGLNCEGGGEPCNTGLVGACSLGRTDCAAQGQEGMCRAIIQPGAELCDNVDNDCNGLVDDGDLCPVGLVCDKGACVDECGTGEFECDAELACDNGLCVEIACQGVVCEPGEACRGGSCLSACEGVVCPSGQECQLGRCVDPCAGIACPAGRVCEKGLCVSDCACRGCDPGLECAADGRCTDPACANVACDPGLVCQLGQCIDPCAGVVCPGNGMCVNGSCTDPTVSIGGTTGAGGSISVGGSLSVGGTGPILTGAGGTSQTGAGGSTQIGDRSDADPGCACSLGSRSSRYGAFAGLLLLGALAMRRKRAA